MILISSPVGINLSIWIIYLAETGTRYMLVCYLGLCMYSPTTSDRAIEFTHFHYSGHRFRVVHVDHLAANVSSQQHPMSIIIKTLSN